MVSINQFATLAIPRTIQSDGILDAEEKVKLLAYSVYFYCKHFNQEEIHIPNIARDTFYALSALPLKIEICYTKVDGDENVRIATRFEQYGICTGGTDTRGAGMEYIRYYDLTTEDKKKEGWRCFHENKLNSATIFGINEDLWVKDEDKEYLENEWLEEYKELADKYLQYAHLIKDLEPLYPIVKDLESLFENDSILYYWFHAGSEFKNVLGMKNAEEQAVLLTSSEVDYFLNSWDRKQASESQRLVRIGMFGLHETPTLMDLYTCLSDGRVVWEHPVKNRKIAS